MILERTNFNKKRPNNNSSSNKNFRKRNNDNRNINQKNRKQVSKGLNKQRSKKSLENTPPQQPKKSIEKKGLLMPITVRKVKDKYEIVAGERRFRATKALGKNSILAHIIKVIVN